MSTLGLFSPLIDTWFTSRFEKPTPIQSTAWPKIASGEHVLLTSPTGTGKTLTAFLSALDRLLSGEWSTGIIRVLYVSPLKALANDIHRNLLEPLEEIQELAQSQGKKIPKISVSIRSGDTPQGERQRMLRRPPEILITTPESLNLLLASPRARELLTGIRTVILDEIHGVVDSKRGTHLITAVDRLVPLSGEFQRIAVSATVQPLSTVAAFVGGFRCVPPGGDPLPRPVNIIEVPGGKQFDISVEFLPTQNPDHDTFWEEVAARLKSRIHRNRSTLIFVNSRRNAEKLALFINRDEQTVNTYAHHGSLSKEIRMLVEQRLKAGTLKAIVATSSLEMGIDIGDLDDVVLVQSPFSVSSAIQRIGRAGHRVGEVSRGTVYPSHGRDILDAALTIRMALDKQIEPVKPVEAPLDVLAQIIIAMCGVEPWDMEELYKFLRTSYPYHTLSREAFDSVIGMLEGRYEEMRIPELKARISVDRISGTITTKKGALFLVYAAGGTIPDRGYYGLYIQRTGDKVGELDEEFVWERRLGDSFTLGTQSWKITSIDHRKVEVIPWSGSISSMTFWRADQVNRHYYYAAHLTEVLEQLDGRVDSPGFAEELATTYPLDSAGSEALCAFLKRQRQITGTSLPHRHHVVAEETSDPSGGGELRLLFYHTLWGGKINKPLELALAALARREGVMLDAYSDNDCILLISPQHIDPDLLVRLAESARHDSGDRSLTALIRDRLDKSGYFGARFRENAGRALLLPRSSPGKRIPLWLTRLRAKSLLDAVKSLPDFPILYETWRECLRDEFDMENLIALLEEVRLGTICLSVVRTASPSPFTSGLRWQHTNKYMYMDDTPESGRDSSLNEATVKDLVLSGMLKPDIPEDVFRRFLAKLHRTEKGYAPQDATDLIDFVKDRCLIPLREWDRLLEAMQTDSQTDMQTNDTEGALSPTETTAEGTSNSVDPSGLLRNILEQAVDRLARVRLPFSDTLFVVPVERLPFILGGLGISLSDLQISSLPIPDGYSNTDTPQIDSPRNNYSQHDSLQYDSSQETERIHSIVTTFLSTTPPAQTSITGLLTEWLRYYGPVEIGLLCSYFGDQVREGVELLADEDMAVVDSFFTGSPRQVCDSDNLERLLYFARKDARPEFTALPVEELQPFLTKWQGLGKTGESVADAAWCLEKLLGRPARADLWESDILPSRLSGYSGAWLDTLLRETDLEWFGCGRYTLAFRFADDANLISIKPTTDRNIVMDRPTNPGADSSLLPDKSAIKSDLLPSQLGRFSFRDIMNHSGLETETLTAALMSELWQGRILCDSFGVVRKFGSPRLQKNVRKNQQSRSSSRTRTGLGIDDFAGPQLRRTRIQGRRRHSPPPLEGNWYAPSSSDDERDLLQEMEDAKERVRLLMSRFGILFRELLRHEMTAFRWKEIFKALRIMELSGEIFSGHFFEGIQGAQFISRPALSFLRRKRKGDDYYWLNAADPASLCGVPIPGLQGRLPSRLPTTRLVYRGSRLLMITRRNLRDIDLNLPPGDPELPLAFIESIAPKDERIKVETVNGEGADGTPYLEDFLAVGFRKGYKTLVLDRQPM